METVGRKTGITERDVWAAADAILADGRRPTIEAVRQHLGRGSPNTVQTYLDTWFGALAQRLHQPTGSSSSAQAGIPVPVTRAAATLWESALALARETLETELAQERTDLEAAQRQLTQDQQKLTARQATLDAQLSASQAQLAAISREREASDLREQSAVAALARAEARIETMTQELARRGEAHEALEAARERDRTEARVQLTAARERLEGQERHWRTEVERARADASKVSRELAELQARQAKESTRHEARIENLEGRLRDAETATRAALQEAAQLQGTVRAMRERGDSARAKPAPRKWGKRPAGK